tara:strand:+ start:6639 stop:6773 length:135 start_codon:yes stop_codon:yes gene_type:complete
MAWRNKAMCGTMYYTTTRKQGESYVEAPHMDLERRIYRKVENGK